MAGLASIEMSTGGEATRRSTATQSTSTTAATANRPSVRAEPQPQSLPWLTAIRNADSQPASSSAPNGSAWPSAVTGSGGTSHSTSAKATAARTAPIQNTDW